ncbi:MAG: hypothetical protein SFU86_05415 [Pirellulaceae bacterium]|nr:hypothetical protein [Pirellulaceae bacterium]
MQATAHRHRLSFSLRTVGIVVALAAIVIHRYGPQIREMWDRGQSPVKTIRTVGELNQAMTEKRAAIFCNVDWSFYSVYRQRVISEFALRWERTMSSEPTEFYVVDLTDPSNVVAAHANKVFGFDCRSGWGEIVWVRDGKPVEYTRYWEEPPSQKFLAALAQRIFGLSKVAAFPGPPEAIAND